MNALERMNILDQHVAMMCRHGFAAVGQAGPFTADIRDVRPPLPGPRHHIYFVLTVLSFGIGALLWLVVVCDNAVKRRRINAEPGHTGTWRIHVGGAGEVETYELLSQGGRRPV
jgi:hypothetical protein